MPEKFILVQTDEGHQEVGLFVEREIEKHEGHIAIKEIIRLATERFGYNPFRQVDEDFKRRAECHNRKWGYIPIVNGEIVDPSLYN
jgi:hypothetical protein